jgi:hypothetical protein
MEMEIGKEHEMTQLDVDSTFCRVIAQDEKEFNFCIHSLEEMHDGVRLAHETYKLFKSKFGRSVPFDLYLSVSIGLRRQYSLEAENKERERGGDLNK